jgi:tRNA threonylcarbamoyladenosine biosynthesis protein TsaE
LPTGFAEGSLHQTQNVSVNAFGAGPKRPPEGTPLTLSELVLELQDLSQTERLAKLIAEAVEGGQFLALSGDLGAGKTTFTRSVTEALNCEKLATSPTFSVLQHYEGGRLRVFHADLYRLGSDLEVYDLGWEEFMDEYFEGLMVVEWADKFPQVLPEDRLMVDCSYADDLDQRIFRLSAHGTRSLRLLGTIRQQWLT